MTKNNYDKMYDMCVGRSIAVIGNSENVTDYEVGNIIDTYDVVVRMNKFNVSEKYEKYTGKKTNIYSTCFWDRVLHKPEMLLNYDVFSVFCSIPCFECKYFSDYQEYKRNLDKAYKIGWRDFLKSSIVYPSPDYFDKIGDMIGSRPSTGTITLCWIMNYLNFDHLYVTGLSFGANKSHYNPENYKGVGPGKKHHNPFAERFAVYNTLNNCDKDVLLDPHMSEVIGNITNEDLYKHKREIGQIA